MKSESDKRFIGLKFLLHFEVEHSEQFASKIFVVPNSNSAIKMTAAGNEGSLLADIHACDGTVVKSFVYILKNNLFISHIVDKI